MRVHRTLVGVDYPVTVDFADPVTETPTAPDGPVTASIVNSNGDVVAEGPATLDGPEATLVLPAAEAPDTFHAVFVGAVAGRSVTVKAVTYAVGARYFTVADVRGLNAKFADTSKYPVERIRELRDWFEVTFETFVEAPLVPRGYASTYLTDGSRRVKLWTTYLRDVAAVHVDGVAVTGWTYADGVLTLPEPVAARTPVRVLETVGVFAHAPGDVVEAGLATVRSRLTETAAGLLSGRETGIDSDAGRFTLAVAGVRRPFGIPEVDGLALRYKNALAVPGVA